MSDSQNNFSLVSPATLAEVRRVLSQRCCCQACEPFYEQRVRRPDPAFADLVPISGREAYEKAQERLCRDLEASADASRILPRVMDLPAGIDPADLRERLARDGFSPVCPQYREVVALLADGSFESAVSYAGF